ncbi:MAG: AmpG family muropeptide MFS transporter [Ignavibacteria bacterium]|nr:AmpG family muropeptide MFS transporter [Ignavibacteria bacterium]MCU7502862.1 AmpG family muropeptide MFS transporter [Ignavibacteria bacterium]MCU7515644.1 AmpG family muropeptide MFS transporter [Ignavibacteria bacterium]
MTKKTLNPAFWVTTLYFAEGLPFVAVATVSVLMYKDMGLSDSQIAFFTTLIAWPWTLKPLWGPVLEMFKTKKYFVIATQFIGGVTFGLLALTLPLQGFFKYSLVLFAIIAFNSATHDIAADGLYINVLSEKEQAKFVGWQGAFYNIAKVFSQGALVYIAGRLELSAGVTQAWMIVMGIFGLVLLCLSLYHMKVLPAGKPAERVGSLKEAFGTFWDVVKTFFKKRNIWWGITFIVLYRFAEGQAVKIVPLFLRSSRLQGGLGLSTSEIGIIYGVFGAAAFVLGSILAGYFTAKRGLKNSLFTLACFFNIPFAVYAFLAITAPENFFIIGLAVVFEYFGYGFGFVGLILFMMQQIAPGKYKMAHYAFATALMNLGFMIPSMISGFLSDFLGYKTFFIWVVIATIPSFLITWLVPFTEHEDEGKTEERLKASINE